MIELTLQREASGLAETMGRLTVGNHTLHTVEQEWRPTMPGGESNNSCVPAGRYELIPHIRPNGDEVVALVNPGLGVYYEEADRPNKVGRFLILMHAGNTSADVVGCIAPGMSRNGEFVGSSRNAMKVIMAEIGDEDAQLLIEDST